MEELSYGDTQSMGSAIELRPDREQRHSELGTSFMDHEACSKEASMIPQLKRHEIQILLKAGHTQEDAARIAAVSLSTVQRVSGEPGVERVDDEAERARRKIGRPSTAEPFRALVEKLLQEEPQILSVEVLRRARLDMGTKGVRALCTPWRPACALAT
jgi:hypothetical protein